MNFEDIIKKGLLAEHVNGLVAKQETDAAVNLTAQVCLDLSLKSVAQLVERFQSVHLVA